MMDGQTDRDIAIDIDLDLALLPFFLALPEGDSSPGTLKRQKGQAGQQKLQVLVNQTVCFGESKRTESQRRGS